MSDGGTRSVSTPNRSCAVRQTTSRRVRGWPANVASLTLASGSTPRAAVPHQLRASGVNRAPVHLHVVRVAELVSAESGVQRRPLSLGVKRVVDALLGELEAHGW